MDWCGGQGHQRKSEFSYEKKGERRDDARQTKSTDFYYIGAQ